MVCLLFPLLIQFLLESLYMTHSQSQKMLKKLQSKDFIPEEILYFLEKMYAIEMPNIKKKCTITIDAKAHMAGKSLLERKDLFPYVHLTKAQERLRMLCHIDFTQRQQKTDFVLSIMHMREKISQEKFFAKNVLQAFLDEDERFYHAQAEYDESFSFVCYFLAYMTFMPFFAHTTAQFAEKYAETVWNFGHCPYCGGAALVSYLKNKEGMRMHACAQCLSLYRSPRIQCPVCLEEQQDMLSYFTADTDKEWQVCHCKKCNNYIKILDCREQEKFIPAPLIDDLLSITLDIICQQKKFTRAALSLWM